MRFLVTGASGLIGAALCDSLLAHGEEVVGLSRDPERARSGNPTVTWLAWNPADERPPETAFKEVDAVVNLVGEEINQRLTPEAKERINGSRVRATKNLVDGMLAASPTPPVLVSQCAVGYYGDRGEAMIDEETPAGTEWLSQLCVDWQNAAMAAQKAGVRVAVFRTGLLLDPDGGLLKQLSLPFKLGAGGPLAGGRQYMPWIHRDDEIGLLTWAAQNPAVSGVLNASAPNPVTNREFSKALGRALRRPAFMPAPKFAVSALRGGELADAISASLRVVPRRALDLGYSFRFTDIDTALRDLYSR
jgi:uncharacterized protein (TIGR01777 family)